jgi:hypothetical protein
LSEHGFIDGLVEGTTFATGAAVLAGLLTPDTLIALAVALAATASGVGRAVEHAPKALVALSEFLDRHWPPRA